MYKYNHRQERDERRQAARQAITRIALLERETGLRIGILESELCIYWLAVAQGLFLA